MHMSFVHPLLAVDFTHLIIPLVAVLFAVLKQLFDAGKKPNPNRPGAPLVPQQKPATPPKPVAAEGGQQADQLRTQVEEFLKRAGQRQQPEQQPQSPRAPQPRPASEIEVLANDASRLPDRRTSTDAARANEARKAAAAANPDKRPARRSVTPKRRVTLAERAADREAVRLGSLPDQPPQLGKRIIEEDKQFDTQLKAKFDHAVGTLAESAPKVQPTATSPARETPAAQIAAMLANPDGVRTAVIINEILRRPSDRW
jgi:hypothetical protein